MCCIGGLSGTTFAFMEQVSRVPSFRPLSGVVLALLFLLAMPTASLADPERWKREWPKTEFTRHSVDFKEILSGGPPKDGIRSIDHPVFVSVHEVEILADTEPVIGLVIDGDARAYPLGVLTRHEIVNDIVGGIPVTVTYCPLCNSGIVFDRRLDGKVLDFGTTGKLRNSDLVMYDRQTESWWQQFLGIAIVGELTGKSLEMIPSRLESFANFRARAPAGKVLESRGYGDNPYAFYDTRSRPYGFFTGQLPKGIEAMARVVAVGNEAWSLSLLRRKGIITKGDLVISWKAGQNSALDSRQIASGRDVGNVIVQRGGKDVVHDVTFAFVFHAFRRQGLIHTE